MSGTRSPSTRATAAASSWRRDRDSRARAPAPRSAARRRRRRAGRSSTARIRNGPRSKRAIRPSITVTRYSTSSMPSRNVVVRKRPRRTRAASPFTSSDRSRARSCGSDSDGRRAIDTRAVSAPRRPRPPPTDGPLLPRRPRHRALLAVVLLQARRRAPSRARARERTGAPLRQSSEQPHRLAGGRRRAAAQGALPGHGRAVSQSAPGALPAAPSAPSPSTGGRTTRTRWTATSTPSPPATPPSTRAGWWPSTPRARRTPRRACSGSRRARPASRSRTRRSRPRALSLIPVGPPSRRASRSAAACSSPSARRSPRPPLCRAYREDPVKAVDALTTAIQWGDGGAGRQRRPHRRQRARAGRGAALPRASWSRELARGARAPAAQVDLLRLSRSIVDAVRHFRTREPERVERALAAHPGLPGAARASTACATTRCRRRRRAAPGPRRRRPDSAGRPSSGFPLFAYGALVNALPYYVPRWLAHRMARKETDYATTRLLASVVAFPVFWGSRPGWSARGAGPCVGAAVRALACRSRALIASRYLIGAGRLRNQLRLGGCSPLRQAPGGPTAGRRAPGAHRRAGAREGTTISPPRRGAASERRIASKRCRCQPSTRSIASAPSPSHREPAGGARPAPAARRRRLHRAALRRADRRAARRGSGPGWSCVLAPTLHLGSFTFEAVGTVTVRQRVVRDVLVDYGASLARAASAIS